MCWFLIATIDCILHIPGDGDGGYSMVRSLCQHTGCKHPAIIIKQVNIPVKLGPIIIIMASS